MGNPQLSPKGKAQRLSPLRRVGSKRLTTEVVGVLTRNGEDNDIVYAHMKVCGALSTGMV